MNKLSLHEKFRFIGTELHGSILFLTCRIFICIHQFIDLEELKEAYVGALGIVDCGRILYDCEHR
jgi:hypothetical protein